VSKRPSVVAFGTRGAVQTAARAVDLPRIPQRRKKTAPNIGLLQRAEIRIGMLAGAAAILGLYVWHF
jgi:hypothetical protein